ncbi:MAG TPA: STAS domain-containing protein [Candidatus Hydrogenedentes bacterium]|nr:STAS domain-containing protein [Candidatus Hydrogenedentota bacterium]
MTIDSEEQGSVRVLRLDGDVDEEGVMDLRVALLRCIREGHSDVVLNLKHVRFMSYMGVGVLVERLRQVRALHGDMKLVGLSLYLDRLFRMVGVTSLFNRYDSESQAVQEFRKAA